MNRLCTGLVVVFAAVLFSTAAPAQSNLPPVGATVYSNIDDTTSPYTWQICSGSCAGGANPQTATFTLNQATPSLDGSSTKFYVQGGAWTDVLFYHHLGANDGASNFQTDYWFMLDSNETTIGQAIEFDTYQFLVNFEGVSGKNSEFMFGSQCDYAQYGGVWDIWDQYAGHWIPQSNMPCVNPTQNRFKPNVWYHVTQNFSRLPSTATHPYGEMSFNSFHVVEYAADNTTITSDYTYNMNLVTGAGQLPSGWGHQMGVQFQMDFNGSATTGRSHGKKATAPSSMTEWVDQVSLTVW
ncbi:MAG: hypothetical protein ACR2IF_14785 [Terriglobales bacterium]